MQDLLLILLTVFFFAKISGGLFRKIGLDSSIGELLTGIVLGPSVLNLIHPESIEPFAIIGSVLILFIAGLNQEHLEEIFKDKSAYIIALILLGVTSTIMSLFFYYVTPFFGINFNFIQSLILALAFSILDIAVPAKVLITKGLMNSEIGKITIHSAIINIILGLFLFTGISLFLKPSFLSIMIKIFGILLFLFLTLGSFYFLNSIIEFTKRIHVEESELSLAIILVLAMAYFTDLIGFSSVIGAFIAGGLIAKMPFSETTSFSYKIKSLSFGIFVPLFFVWFGMETNLGQIIDNFSLVVLIFITYTLIRFTLVYLIMKKKKVKTPGIVSSAMLSVDVESLVVLVVAVKSGLFNSNLPLSLFAPSVFLSTTVIVLLVSLFSKLELNKA